MAGIVGLIGEGSLSEVIAMGDRMPHRGRHTHAWSPAPGIYFGCRGPTDAPPIPQLVADAQLDDFSLSDLAEVLSRGPGELTTIGGYFSLAYWDDARGQVVLACDTAGFKSLYYVQLEGRIAFASEYKALLALSDVQAELNRDAAQYYLAAKSFRMDRPMLSGVRSLTAGSVLSVQGGRAERGSYWSAARRVEARPRQAFEQEVRETLERVVTRQTSKFSRVGVTLSGGLDSACVVSLLRKTRPDLHIASYTVGFGPEDPEMQGGRDLAETSGTQHNEVTFDPESIRTHLPSLVWLQEDCFGQEDALLMHLCLNEVSRYEKVVFGGHGADTLFAGQPRYRLIRMRDTMPWMRTPLSEVFQLTQTGMEPRTLLGRIGQRLLTGSARWPVPSVLGARTLPSMADGLTLDQYIGSQMIDAQDSGYLEPTLESGEVEFRDPFQSTEMLDLALRIPGHYNVGFFKQKMILRNAVTDMMPKRVNRRGKSLQRVPYDARMSDILDDMASRLLTTDAIRARGIVSPDYVRKLRDRQARPYGRDRIRALWALLSLELWQRAFIDNRGRADISETNILRFAPPVRQETAPVTAAPDRLVSVTLRVENGLRQAEKAVVR